MKSVRKVISKICKSLSYISCAAVFFVMMLMVVDIILSLTTTTRVLGNYELTELGMTLVIFFGLAYTQVEKGHVRVDMFIGLMPKRFSKFLDSVITLITAAVCALMTYGAFTQAGTYASSGTGSAVLHIPFSPFGYVMAIGFLLLTIVILLDAIDMFIEGVTFKSAISE